MTRLILKYLSPTYKFMNLEGGQMKVVIITNYWKNSPGGGIKTYLTNLVDEFDKRDDLDVSVLFKEGVDADNFHIRGNKFIFAFKAFCKLKELRPSVLHSQGTWYCLLPGYVYKFLYNVPLIHTFHSQPLNKLHWVGRIFFQTLLNGCDCTTFVSKSLKTDYEMYDTKFKRSAITYAGVNSREVSQKQITDFCDKFNIKSTSYVLLAQGFMSDEFKAKGAKILISSLKLLLNKNPHTVLVLTGDGSFSNEVKSFAENMNLSEHVIFTGYLSDPFVPLAMCDLYTHVSLADGLPLSLLEAMVMGKPILASNIGGIPEAIDDGVNGVLVEPYEEQIQVKIEYLMSNPNVAEQMGGNAKRVALNKFTWEKAANSFESVYSN